MSKFSILLIDDEESVRFGFSRYLQRENFCVDEAGCILEARLHMRQRDYDALILDLDLPDGDGLVYLKDIRIHNPRLPILIVSGSASRSAEECMTHGANYFLPKPVSMAELNSALQRLLTAKTTS